MSNKKPQKTPEPDKQTSRRRNKKQAQQATQEPPRWSDKTFVRAIGAVLLVFLASVLGWKASPPPISVELVERVVDPREISSLPFIITNTGIFTAKDVYPSCYAHEIRFRGQPNVNFEGNTFNSMGWGWPTKMLRRGESHEIGCDLKMAGLLITGGEVEYLDISITVIYSLRGIPIYRPIDVFRYVSTKSPDGKLHFYPRSSAEIRADAIRRFERR